MIHVPSVVSNADLRDALTNPKHTANMVRHRKTRKGPGHNRAHPLTEWSTCTVHYPLVDLETFVQAQLGRPIPRTFPSRRRP